MNKKYIFLLIVILSAAVLFSGCDPFDGVYRDGTRNITIDIDNGIFRRPDAVNAWEQGPGVDSVTIVYVLKDNEISNTIASTDASGGGYTQISHEVAGRLERVDVSGLNAAGISMTVSIDDKPKDEEFYGWETFANIQRFRIGCNADSSDGWSSSYLTIDIAPCGGSSVRFKADSGVTAQMETDWGGAALVSSQIAVEPILVENPEGLTFDIYTCIVDDNLKELYKPGYINPAANYEYYPWTEVWTHDEITVSGKRIGEVVYKFAKHNTDASLPFIEPAGEGCGYNSVLLDLTAGGGAAGKYLMYVIVSKYDVLSVPSAVGIVEIR